MYPPMCVMSSLFVICVRAVSTLFVPISHRLQRLSLVENEGFHKSLLEAAISDTSSDHLRHRALDLLLWLTSIHTAAGEKSAPCIILSQAVPSQLHLAHMHPST